MGLFKFLKKAWDEAEVKPVEKVKLSRNIIHDPDVAIYYENYARYQFLKWCKKGREILNRDEYPPIFSFGYGIRNSKEYHEYLIESGYLKEIELSQYLNKYKIPELKSILKDNGIKTTGKKADLIQRLLENPSIIPPIEKVYYVPSEKGLNHLEQYDHYDYLKEYGIDIDDFESLNGNIRPRDTMWSILNRDFLEHMSKGMYTMIPHNLDKMGRFLLDEGREKNALSFFIRSINYEFYDMLNPPLIKLQSESKSDYKKKCLEYKEYSIHRILAKSKKIQILKHQYTEDMLNDVESIPNGIKPLKFKKYINDVISGEIRDIDYYL